MPIFRFDGRGNLFPYDIISFNHEEFESFFLFSSRRIEIYEGYKRYCRDMLETVPSMRHWIDGSFTTVKVDPADIDLVCFVRHEDFTQSLADFDTNFSHGRCKTRYNVDGYIVIEVPKDDPKYETYYLERIAYWRKWFGHDRSGNPKGVAKLRYG